MIDRDGMLKPHGRCAPSPLVGEGWGGEQTEQAATEVP